MLAHDDVEDVIERFRLPRRLATMFQVPYEVGHRQALRLRQGRSEDRGNQYFVCRRERLRVIVLKDPPARRRRTRLEDGPDSCAGIGCAEAGERFGDGRRMMREVVED